MSEQEAIAVANEAAQAGGANLDDYRSPRAALLGNEWVLLYQERKLQAGGHFLAVVDQSGRVRLVAGA